jgi:uncharacterized protein (TIGR00725 family)
VAGSGDAARCIAVIGAARADAALSRAAGEVGAASARAGWSLVCGGLGGVMDAACQGFREARDRGDAPAGGRTIGLLPGADRAAAGPAVDLVFPTGLGYARNVLVVLAGEAVVAVGGGSGTLSEVCHAWQHGRPVCLLGGTGGLADELGLAGRRLDWRHERPIHRADDAAAAVAWCIAAADEVRRGATG